MLNYEEFQEYAKNHVKDYMPEEQQGASVTISSVIKNNGLTLDGLVVTPEGSNIAPTIYLNGYFKKYQDGADIKEIMEEIGRITSNHVVAPQETTDIGKKFLDFDFVKDKIVMSVVNAAKNAEMLAYTPHKMVEDLAVIYRVFLESTEQGVATITIKDTHMEHWGVDVDMLDKLAMENSQRLLPAETSNMNTVMMQMMGEDMPPEIAEQLLADMPLESQMFVITNNEKLNGAAAILYSNELEKLSEKMGTDLYILPSSVHEVIAVSSEMGDPESLAEMVREVNGTQVSIDEQLSDHVYHYDALSKEITLADTTLDKVAEVAPVYNASTDEPRRSAARR